MVAAAPSLAGSSDSPALAERYAPLFPLGQGGMATVEAALERGGTGFARVVALKRLLPESARDPRRREMFLREGRLLGLLRHPNVAHAFAFGEAGGELFLALEYVEGEPLSRVLERGGALPPALAAIVVAAMCDGLHAAHELADDDGAPLGLVHRDVSPHNVMIAFDGAVKLLDFGVAKVEAASGVTRTGEVKGKMAFMSPEQALGEALDRRSDLYAVGAVLFECVSGRRMWGDGTDMEVLRRLALEEPPRLAGDAELAALHAKLCARDPATRPDDAHAVAESLRGIAARLDPAAGPESLRAHLGSLFAEEAEARQRALAVALDTVAPTQAEALRASIHSAVPVIPASSRRPAPAVPVATVHLPQAKPAIAPRAIGAIAAAAAVFAALAFARVTGDRATPGEPPSARTPSETPSSPVPPSEPAPAGLASATAIAALPTPSAFAMGAPPMPSAFAMGAPPAPAALAVTAAPAPAAPAIAAAPAPAAPAIAAAPAPAAPAIAAAPVSSAAVRVPPREATRAATPPTASHPAAPARPRVAPPSSPALAASAAPTPHASPSAPSPASPSDVDPTPFDRAAALLGLALSVAVPAARADDDDLAVHRDTFKRGMDRYKAGAVGEAIVYWETVYRSLGPAKGYRVAFNLARAYDALGDATHAAEHYETFLAEAEARSGTGEALDALVAKETEDARARLGELAASRGRIRVTASGQIDRIDARAGATVYVSPGAHVVTLGPGDERTVTVRAGERIEVAPHPTHVAPPPVPAPSAPAAIEQRPFSPALLWIAGGVTAAAGVFTAVQYGSALSKKSEYVRATTLDEQQRLYASYPSSRELAYVSLAVSATLAAGTAALATWYVLGRTHLTVTPGVAAVGVRGSF